MQVVFFNRIPNVGSWSMMTLLELLGHVNDFDIAEDHIKKFLKPIHDENELKHIAETIAYIDGPFSYTHQVNYINFTEFELPRPIYINLIREPVERVISWFHSVRTSWYIIHRKKSFPDLPFPDINWVRKSFETCVLTHDPECVYEQDSMDQTSDHRRQMLFFCGHSEKDCLGFNSEKTLQIAKRNVEKEYAVVGSWEDTNVTLTVLEHYIPRFFKGGFNLFHKNKKKLKEINKNTLKPKISEHIKHMLRKNFTNEIEFYNFCKQRLYKQYLALRIDKHD